MSKITPNISIRHANFLASCLMGRLREVQEFIKEGVDINGADRGGYSALHFAAKCSDPLVAEELLTYPGIDINLLHPIYGLSALHFACKFKNVKVAEKLIAGGASIDIQRIGEEQYSTKDTPLHCAIEKGDKQLLKLLFDNHADINAQNCAGKTPLHLAVEAPGKKIALVVLLCHGAKTTVRDNSSKLPFHYAIDKISLAMLAAARYADKKSTNIHPDEEFKYPDDINEEYKDLIRDIIVERMVNLSSIEGSSHPSAAPDTASSVSTLLNPDESGFLPVVPRGESQVLLTRTGTFSTDSSDNLVNESGTVPLFVHSFTLDSSGAIIDAEHQTLGDDASRSIDGMD